MVGCGGVDLPELSDPAAFVDQVETVRPELLEQAGEALATQIPWRE